MVRHRTKVRRYITEPINRLAATTPFRLLHVIYIIHYSSYFCDSNTFYIKRNKNTKMSTSALIAVTLALAASSQWTDSGYHPPPRVRKKGRSEKRNEREDVGGK
jgi:hypothetical protein